MRSAAPDSTDTELRRILGAFLFSGETVDQRAGTLSGGERTRLAMATLVVSGANVLLLDEPTNNLDPASREQVLEALRTYAGAIVLVTHDEGAVRALDPDKVILLPDGTEDAWSEDFADLVDPLRLHAVPSSSLGRYPLPTGWVIMGPGMPWSAGRRHPVRRTATPGRLGRLSPVPTWAGG